VIFTIDHHRRRFYIERVAGLLARPGTPTGAQDRLQPIADLRIEFMRGSAFKLYFLPIEICWRRVSRREACDFVIIEIGRHEYGMRMLVEAVHHLLDRKTDILQAVSLPTTRKGMVGNMLCMARIVRVNTVPSPMPASSTRSAGGLGFTCFSSCAIRAATCHF